jgi:hypothetical protein
MVLQSSGAISFANIQTEFGGTNPIGINEYYNDNASLFTKGIVGIPSTNNPISLSQFYGKSKKNGLYTFSTFTFTNAGAGGRFGPTLSQVRSAYSAASWAQDSVNNYLNMSSQGIQEWKVPSTGSYTINVGGAAGGNNGYTPGYGARMIGTFNLTEGMVLSILVGQLGAVKSYWCNAGGGGGTFVWNKNSTSQPLIVAGGGGGGNGCGGNSGLNAPVSINASGGSATSTTGINGYGANPGGSGWFSSGTSGYAGNNSGCLRPLQGGYGGAAQSYFSVGDGGFGGGASASGEGCSNGGPGGGGGYSGGAGPSRDWNCPQAGGGGSYNSGSSQNNTAGAVSGNGYVTITANFTIIG